MRRRELLGLGGSTAVALLTGCSKDGKKGGKGGDEASLPPIQFSVDTPDLMLTWIDDRGGTHVESKVERVPSEQARLVRISGGDAKDSSVEIYVADVSEPSKEYTAHGYARSAWEDEIARRRKDNPDVDEGPRPRPREARAPRRGREGNAPGDPHGRPDSDRDSPPDSLDPSMKGVTVIVYGASWCSACHAALDHLRGKGVKTVFKNIETDRSASEEMSVKLDKAGARRGSIPVIDIAGQIIVGFSARDIDRALKKAVSSPKGASGTLM